MQITINCYNHNGLQRQQNKSDKIVTHNIPFRATYQDTLCISTFKKTNFIKIFQRIFSKRELTDAEKYIKQNCKVRKKGKNTVIIAKRGNFIDLSKIGELKNGTLVRYNTPEEARNAAKDFLMKQFELPIGKQIECGVAVEGSDILGISIGDERRVEFPECMDLLHSISATKRTIDFYHNHPLIENGIDYPISGDFFGDIGVTIRNNTQKSMTAYNHLGEYSRIEIVDSDKLSRCENMLYDEMDDYLAMALLGNKKGTRYIYLRHNRSKDTPEELKNEYEKLLKEYSELWKEFSNKKPQKLVQIQHERCSKILPKYGIEYTTNYSNLK